MGSYATTTAIPFLLAHFLKGNSGTTDAFGESLSSHHIANAESIVNSFVASRYSLPFIVGTTTTNVPPQMRHWSEQIACYNILKSSSWVDPKARNAYADDFKGAMEDLKAVAAGNLKLTYTDGSIVPTRSTTRFQSSSINYTPIFGRDEARHWNRDEDEVSDTEDARG